MRILKFVQCHISPQRNSHVCDWWHPHTETWTVLATGVNMTNDAKTNDHAPTPKKEDLGHPPKKIIKLIIISRIFEHVLLLFENIFLKYNIKRYHVWIIILSFQLEGRRFGRPPKIERIKRIKKKKEKYKESQEKHTHHIEEFYEW